MTRFTKWRPPYSDLEKYKHGHIYETDLLILVKFVAKCQYLQPLSSEIIDILCIPIPLKLLKESSLVKTMILHDIDNKTWSCRFDL